MADGKNRHHRGNLMSEVSGEIDFTDAMKFWGLRWSLDEKEVDM